MIFEINLLSIKRNLQNRDKAIINNLFVLIKNVFIKFNINASMFEKQLTLTNSFNVIIFSRKFNYRSYYKEALITIAHKNKKT